MERLLYARVNYGQLHKHFENFNQQNGIHFSMNNNYYMGTYHQRLLNKLKSLARISC